MKYDIYCLPTLDNMLRVMKFGSRMEVGGYICSCIGKDSFSIIFGSMKGNIEGLRYTETKISAKEESKYLSIQNIQYKTNRYKDRIILSLNISR